MIFQHVRITPDLHRLFQTFRLSTARKGERWNVGDIIALDPEARIEKYAQVIVGSVLPLELGAFSYGHSVFSTEMAVGRYCSLSWDVEVMGSNHPMDWVTTSPVTHYPQDIRGLSLYLRDIGAKEYGLHRFEHGRLPMTVGDDVWIGAHVMIKRGISIGHGAVVGAGSIVMHDVTPYAIVAGAPARILRHRFEGDLIAELLDSEWWRFGPEVVQALDVRDPARFLDGLRKAIADGLQPLSLPVLTGAEIIDAEEHVG